VAWAEAYHRAKWHLDPFGHNKHWTKSGGRCCAPFLGGEQDPHLTQCSLGRGLPQYQVAGSIQPFGPNRYGPKSGRLRCGGEVGSTSNTMWPGLRPTTVPSGILIRLATISIGQKVGEVLCPFLGGEQVPHLKQCSLGRGLPRHQVAS